MSMLCCRKLTADPTGKFKEESKPSKDTIKPKEEIDNDEGGILERIKEFFIGKAKDKAKEVPKEAIIEELREQGKSEDQICRLFECGPDKNRWTSPSICGLEKCFEYAVDGKKYGTNDEKKDNKNE